jgi:glutathione S-transferase
MIGAAVASRMSSPLLYIGNRRYSSWSLRPYLVLAASGLEFRTEVIGLDQPGTAAAITAVNPAGRVPVLHHDGLVIHDSLAICEYVAELVPSVALWPRDRAARARARSAAAEMHAGFAALRRDMSMDLGVHQPGVGHTPGALADVARIVALWRGLRALAPHGRFLCGEFSIVDAFFAPVVARFRGYGVAVDDDCADYLDAVWTWPAMVEWRAAAALEAALPNH